MEGKNNFDFDFDVVVVGSSPLMLIESLYQKQVLNKSVCVVEKARYGGGAWKTSQLFDLDHIEVGCHYLSRSNLGYKLLEDHIGVKLEKVDRHFYDFTEAIVKSSPSKKKTIENGRASIIENDDPKRAFKVAIKKMQIILKALVRLDFPTIDFSIKRIRSIGAFKYPKYGCSDLTERLISLCMKNNIIFKYNTEIEKAVHIDNNQISLHTSNNVIQTKKLLLGQGVRVPLFKNSNKILISHEDVLSTHMILKIKGKKNQDFIVLQKEKNASHWLDDDNYFFRITDVGRYFKDGDKKPEEGTLLLCCQISGLKFTGKEDPLEIIQYLKNLNLINQEASMIASHVDVHHGSMILKDNFKKETKNLPPNIKIFGTWDLTFCMEEHYGKWSKINFN